jgi:hypothetical protein
MIIFLFIFIFVNNAAKIVKTCHDSPALTQIIVNKLLFLQKKLEQIGFLESL